MGPGGVPGLSGDVFGPKMAPKAFLDGFWSSFGSHFGGHFGPKTLILEIVFPIDFGSRF